MNPIWFVRAKRWVQNPPSPKRIKLVFGVIALCALLYGIEYFIGWPDVMSLERPSRGVKVKVLD